jgi:Ca2+-binding RTX toxin-like protein
MSTYTIREGSWPVSGVGNHMYWKLYKDGSPIAELQAMPVDANGEIVSAPFGELQFFQYSLNPQAAKELGVLGPIRKGDLSGEADNAIVAYQTNSLQDALSCWNAGSTKIPYFNSQNVPYFFLYENSNTGHRAFGEAMGLPVIDFDIHVTPGLDLKLDPNWLQDMSKDILKYYLDNWELTDNTMFNAEYYLSQATTNGIISAEKYWMLTTPISDWLLSNPNTGLYTSGYSLSSLTLDPIGAFYDSQSLAYDNALSIADRTGVLVDSSGRRVSVAKLQGLDANHDGVLSVAEASGLKLLTDLNENGHLDAGELNAVKSAIRSVNWSRLTRGNAVMAGCEVAAPTAAIMLTQPLQGNKTQAVPASNYRTLRDTDNRYRISSFLWIDWTSSKIKINNSTRNTLIGTDGNDSFDSGYYKAYASWFPTPLTNFLGGGGNDRVGGSTGNDNIWGGTGNDTLYGYAGNDKLYGEEGNDELQGNEGNDYLDGGSGDDKVFGQVGNDTLFGGDGADELQGNEGNDQLVGGAGDDKLVGQVGNDTLWGGDGNDLLMGFTGTNEAKQTLSAGETDDDILYGEGGNDNIYGGLGNDFLDGGTGNDLLLGDQGNDTLFGGDGADELQGNEGNDQLLGGSGDDKLFGQVGNDILWGGDGNDLLMGFTGTNEAKQTLSAGETDDDSLYGGAGNDILIGGLGADLLYGGDGRDELQGGIGNDILYGDGGNDNLFGQVGDDTLYGGEGDDVLMGFTASNESKQRLSAGETDDDYLYGGAGHDTLIGGVGNDYLDGGAGSDVMVGGTGNDTYIVNSVNDTIYEATGEGYDTVITNTNYLLNANIEELRLVEGSLINGTGNAIDNLIVGNSSDNILDGVTGADTMIGGQGNDIYYVDNVGDLVTELASEGTDTVQSSISYQLGGNVENLLLLDFAKPESGLVNGESVLVYGYPKRNELDYMQGDAVENYQGTCALTAIANLITQTGRPTSESQIINLAIQNNWALNNPSLPAWQLGGSNVTQQRAILDSYGIRNDVVMGYNESGIANLVRSGRGVILGVNAGQLWGDSAYNGNGSANHAITLTGAVYRETDGLLMGFYITDSGRGLVSDMTRFIDIETFRNAVNITGGYAIYTIAPVKFWQEDINGTGNELKNTVVGNRGDNMLSGLAGNDLLQGAEGNDTLLGGSGADTLDGGAGNDVLDGGVGNDTLTGGQGNDLYRFARGGGQDVIVEKDVAAGNSDVLALASDVTCDQLWLRHVGNDLVVSIIGGTESVAIRDWYSGSANHIEQIRAGDGRVLSDINVDALVQAMSIMNAPAAGQTVLPTAMQSQLAPVLAASWG